MHKEQEERRDFLPDLIAHLDRIGAGEIVLEAGYGLGMGVPIDAYLEVSDRVRVGSYGQCLDQTSSWSSDAPSRRSSGGFAWAVLARCCTT
jgi:hypothetical protein